MFPFLHPNSNIPKGIVIKYNQFGDYTTFGSPLATNSRGKTLVHEMGHFLGLLHPFQGGCQGLDSNNCAKEGDMCCDVPAVLNQYSSCTPLNSCTETYNGDSADQKRNYMDYTVQTCTNTFTADQRALMHYTLETYKEGMISLENIKKADPLCCVLSAQFEAPRMACGGDSIYCKALLYSPAVQSIWQFYRNDSLISSNSTLADSFNYQVPMVIAPYHIKLLRIFANGDTLVNFHKNYFEVFDCTDTLRNIAANWYFGRHVEWKFGNNTPFPRWADGPNEYFKRKLGSEPQINTDESTLSMSDSMGRLLFYGGVEIAGSNNGFLRIYDNEYREMAGSPLTGVISASSGAISFRRPNHPNQYYIAHLEDDNLLFSIVDMSVISGTSNGAIIAKDSLIDPLNTPFQGFIEMGEAVNALQSCNPNVWYIYAIGNLNTSSFIYIYRADSAGIQFWDTLSVPYAGRAGETLLEISADGTLLSYRNQLYRINRANGSLTLVHTDLSPFYDFTKQYPIIWGVSFSPNSKLLYRYIQHVPYTDPITSAYIVPSTEFGLYQFDLSSQAADLGKTLIAAKEPLEAAQLGADGQLYYANYFKNYSSVVTKPNTLIENGTADVGYIANGPKTGVGALGGQFNYGLPHLVDALPDLQVTPDFKFTFIGCDSVLFESNQCCATAINWNFGDGNSGSGQFVGHRYATKDSFTATMNVDGRINTQKIKSPFMNNEVNIFAASSICDTGLNANATAIYKSSYQYNWSGTNISNTYATDNNFSFTPNAACSIYLHILDKKTGCDFYDTLEISINPAIVNNTMSVIDTSFCIGDSLKAAGTTPTGGFGNYTYQWQYSTDNINWLLTMDSTKDMLRGFKSDSNKYFVRRLVIEGTCIYYSNTKIFKTKPTDFTNNLIFGDSYSCYNYNIIASGNIPSGHPGPLKYLWEYTADSSQGWLNAPDTFYHMYQGFTPYYGKTYLIRRFAYFGNCKGYSNVLKTKDYVVKDTIKQVGSMCLTSGPISINDAGTQIGQVDSFYYGYEVSDDSIYWTPINNFKSTNLSRFTSFDTTLSNKTSTFYIRRYMEVFWKYPGSSCSKTSNVLTIKSALKVKRQPHDVYVCNPIDGGTQSFGTYMQLHNPDQWPATFYYAIVGGGTKSTLVVNQADSFYNGTFTMNSAGRDTIYIKATIHFADCGDIFSDTFKIFVQRDTDNFAFTQLPQDLLIGANDTGVLKAKVNTTQLNGWSWQVATAYIKDPLGHHLLNGLYVMDSSTISGAVLDSLKVNPASTKSNGNHFRAVAKNGCYTKSTPWALVNYRNYDIYMKDFFAIPSQNLPADNGAEPNTYGHRNYTHSYDLWVSKTKSFAQPTQWSEMDIFNPDADTQYVKVKIRNRSNQTSAPASLQLYWTNASTAEEWPKHWTRDSNNRRLNIDSARYYYEGGKINYNSIIVPPITANGDTVLTFAWPKMSNYADTVPQNTWFRYTKPDGTRDYAAAQGICLLARIQHCENNNCDDTTSDGMTFKEKKGNVSYNIMYNNNIVSTNMRRLYLNPPKDDPLAFVMANPIRVRSMNDVNSYSPVWKMHSVNNNFDNIGEAYVYMDYNFWTMWNTQSQPGQHFTVLAPGVIKMTNKDSMVLGPLNVQPGFAADLGFGYNLKPNGTPAGGDTAYSFDFVQSYTDSVMHFEGIVSTYFSGPQFVFFGGGNNGYGDMVEEEKEKEDSTQMKEFIQNLANNQQVATIETTFVTENTYQTKDQNPLAKTNNITVYPNPFTDILKVDVTNTKTSKVSIWITDLNGKIVSKSIINQGIAAGKTQFSIHGSSLAAGTYIVHIHGVHPYTQKEKVMLVR